MTQFKIKAFDIEYSITAEDVWFLDNVENFTDEDFDREIERIKNELPQELELEITCEPEDLEDELVDTISEETGWLIEGCSYDVIERKNVSKNIYKLS